MHKVAVYPGTFDPITNGHLDIINRGLEIFDSVIVAVLENAKKKPLFSAEERVEMIRNSVDRRTEVGSFSGLLVDYMKKKNTRFELRGMRAMSDFDYEFQMSIANKKLWPEMETVFIMTDQKYLYLNSSLVKELARLGADISEFVPKNVETVLKKKLQ